MDEVGRLLVAQQGVATRAQLRAAGLSRRALEQALATGRLRPSTRSVVSSADRPGRGRFLLSAGACDPGYVADVRAALLALGPGAAARRRTAAVLWGIDLAVEPGEIEMAVGPGRSRVQLPGVVATRSAVPVVDLQPLVSGAPVTATTALQTVVDCARELPLPQGVAAIDSALRLGVVDRDELWLRACSGSGGPGRARLRRAVRLSDVRCESVLESLLRVLLAEAGLLPPRTQHEVRDGRVLVARVDLCWPTHRLVVEADGRRWHDPDDARDHDRRRENELARLGWTVLRFTWADVVHEPRRVVECVRACLARAAA